MKTELRLLELLDNYPSYCYFESEEEIDNFSQRSEKSDKLLTANYNRHLGLVRIFCSVKIIIFLNMYFVVL